MKHVLFLFALLLILVTTPVQPQTDEFTYQKTGDVELNVDTRELKFLFTADSTSTTFLSEEFWLGDWDGVDFYTKPITWFSKKVSTYGRSNTKIVLYGVTSWNDTIPLDTAWQWNALQTESDTSGTWNLNGKTAVSYFLGIQNATADINSGYFDIVLPKREDSFQRPGNK